MLSLQYIFIFIINSDFFLTKEKDCLDSFTNLEHLEENSYRCSTCYDENKMLTSATKQMIFHQLPEVCNFVFYLSYLTLN